MFLAVALTLHRLLQRCYYAGYLCGELNEIGHDHEGELDLPLFAVLYRKCDLIVLRWLVKYL